MAYEQPRVTRRSISHGALNHSYVNQSRISSESGHLLPPFRPLRSIREHQHTHLDPSNSVAGMLRKTTETGNIGIFSIGKSTGLRTRASLSDFRQPARSFSCSNSVPPVQDDRRQLPSYRDSTSEIISMYGSENLSGKSISGTLSPPWDDCGQRSYSMTTCGSKGYFTPRNNGHQQMPDFHSKGQRPRSPYPYPTRLARPGVRPSSPALTENGLVDYSRMVEINRVSQRTTHHPHKTLFPHQTTRNRLPLSMRYDINQSTLSPSDDLDSNRPCDSSHGNRPSLSNNPHLWRPQTRDRLENAPPNQSLRTMSLTSMSGRYSSPLRAPYVPLAPKKPLFYDYSEDFEDTVEPLEVSPIAPIPRRVSKKFSPLIAENDPDAISNAESNERDDEDILACLRRSTNIRDANDDDGLEPEQFRPVSQLGQRSSSVQPTSRLASMTASVTTPISRHGDEIMEDNETSHMAPMEQEQAIETSAAKVAVVITEASHSTISVNHSTDDFFDRPETPGVDFKITRSEPPSLRVGHPLCVDQRTDGNGFESESSASVVTVKGNSCGGDVSPNALTTSPPAGMSPNRGSDYRKDSRPFSLSSGLSDLASFVKYIDRHIESSGTEDDSRDETPAIQSSKTAPGLNSGSVQAKNAKFVALPPRKSSLRPCGVHDTGLNTNHGPMLRDEIDQFQIISTRSGPTLVPQPISPAKMLRVKNSIPQLMKALPPLPGYSPAPESPFGPAVVPIDFEPFEISRLTDARSTLTEDILQGRRGHSEDGPKGHDPFVFDRRAQKPRLKLKHTASCATGHSKDLRRGYFEQSDLDSEPRPSTAGQPSHAPVKRRLPIKISRNALTSSGSEETGTMRRRPDLKKSGMVSELTSIQPIDLFGDPVAPIATGVSVPQTVSAKSKDPSLGVAPQRTPGDAVRRLPRTDDALSPFSEIRLSSLDVLHADSEGHDEVGMQSFFSDNNINIPRRGLRTKISNLRAKLSEPKNQQQPHLQNDVYVDCLDNPNQMPNAEVSSTTNTFKDLLSGMSQSKNHHKNPANQRVRGRLGRFMQGAKHKLRIWGHHRRRIN